MAARHMPLTLDMGNNLKIFPKTEQAETIGELKSREWNDNEMAAPSTKGDIVVLATSVEGVRVKVEEIQRDLTEIKELRDRIAALEGNKQFLKGMAYVITLLTGSGVVVTILNLVRHWDVK
jgi:hypothetical protein